MPQIDPNILIAIAGFVLSGITILLTYRAISRKTLRYTLTPVPIITEEKLSGIQQHTVIVDGQSANNLIRTHILFENIGNIQIDASDFSETMPLRIVAENKIFQPQNGYQVYSTDPGSITLKIIDEKTMEITCAYIKPSQPFAIVLLHDGNLSVSGELKTGKMRNGPYYLSFEFGVALTFFLITFILINGTCIYTIFTLFGSILFAVLMSLVLCLSFVFFTSLVIDFYKDYATTKRYKKKHVYPNQ